jgi:hypothetical protein
MDDVPTEVWIERYPAPMAAIANELRSIVRQALPGAIERVRPGWRLIGYDLPPAAPRERRAYVAYIAPEPIHVHLGFEHGWAMRDPRGVLEGAGITRQVRWLTFRPGDPIDADVCIELLHEAARVTRMTRGERILRAFDEADR